MKGIWVLAVGLEGVCFSKQQTASAQSVLISNSVGGSIRSLNVSNGNVVAIYQGLQQPEGLAVL